MTNPSAPTSPVDQKGAHAVPESDFAPERLLTLYRDMLLIRGFEQRVSALYRDGEVPGFVHLSIGQEAAAVGACWPLRPTDVITSTHRRNRRLQTFDRTGAGPDLPTLSNYPESRYLKVLWARVI